VKNVWLTMAQMGSRKIAQTNLTQRVGTVSRSDAAIRLLDPARATLRTTFLWRLDFRSALLRFDFRCVALNSSADYADLHSQTKTEQFPLVLVVVLLLVLEQGPIENEYDDEEEKD
jgi:hypothetical protein